MVVTIQNVQLNVVKQGRSGPYTVHIITYQGPEYQGRPGKVVTRDIFLNSRDYPQLPQQAAALQIGQQAELTFVAGRNPQFKDLTSIIPAGQQQQQSQQNNYQYQGQPQNQQPVRQTPAPQTQAAPKPAYKVRDFAAETRHRDERDDLTSARINRQTALKAGVDLVIALLAKDGYKKTIKLDVLALDVEKMADQFEAYLLKINGFEAMAEEEQPPLPTEEPLYTNEEDIPY